LQAGVDPQRQLPVAEQVSAVKVLQATHVPPAVPQVASEAVWQVPLAQQPVGQDVALHTQVPLMQVVPAPHAGLLPHRQAPVKPSQVSAVVDEQALQLAPPVPQVVKVGAWQAPPAQHPLGHDCALQTQAPLTHTVPAPHAGLVPQPHSPVTEQTFARVGSHATQAAPLTPQVPSPALVQVAPEQQPPGQLEALQPLHTPPAQLWEPQSWQAAPPLPQVASALPGRHVIPEQQPFGHDVPSHTHVPPKQRCPVPQAAPLVPQAQTPPDRQRSAVMPQAVQSPPEVPQLPTAAT
jgi:hypothetical protein